MSTIILALLIGQAVHSLQLGSLRTTGEVPQRTSLHLATIHVVPCAKMTEFHVVVSLGS